MINYRVAQEEEPELGLHPALIALALGFGAFLIWGAVKMAERESKS